MTVREPAPERFERPMFWLAVTMGVVLIYQGLSVKGWLPW